MAGTQSEAQFNSVEEEIAALKETWEQGVKVIRDIGDFTHVVDLKLRDSDLAIKFQLEGTYPSVAPHVVVKTKTMTTEDREKLSLHLTSEAAHLLDTYMMETVARAALQWLQENNIVFRPASPDAHKNKQGSSPKTKKNKQKSPRPSVEDVQMKKKASMKTAEDVISRIVWDDLPVEFFIIGYLDRFLGVVEKKFGDFSWEDLASVDYDTLAIPKHRIQYFKYKNVKVWDKSQRLDNVFGSTGSAVTIHDVIEKYEAEQHQTTCADWAHMEERNESDDDDDVEILTDVACEDGEEYTPRRAVYWGEKNRPTHFICVRVTSLTAVQCVKELHDRVLELEPEIVENMIPAERLHVTLACVGLDTEDMVQHAATVLRKLEDELAEWQPRDIVLNFNEVGHFFNTVLYAKVQLNPAFVDFAEHVRGCLREAGIEIRDVFDFVPHMTLLKLSRQLRQQSRCPYLDPRIVATASEMVHGAQIIDNIHLCEMSETRREDGFYVSPAHITF